MNPSVKELLEANQIQDAKLILAQRTCLNKYNICCHYVSETFRAGGLFVTSAGTAFDVKWIIWCGIGLGSMGTLFAHIQGANSAVLKTMKTDLERMLDGNYVAEEDVLIDVRKNERADPKVAEEKNRDERR